MPSLAKAMPFSLVAGVQKRRRGRWIEQCLTNKYLPEAGTCMLGRGIRIIHGRTLQALDNKHMVRAASSYVYPHQACNGKKGEKAE